MKKSFLHFCGLMAMSLALTGHAAVSLTTGQKLTREQIAGLGELPVYDIEGKQIRVIPSPQQAGDPETMLINSQGVVGSSRNEVAISGSSLSHVQTIIRQVTPQPLSVQVYEPTGIAVARFADFGQAIEGLRALKAALPDAQVRLSVQFGKQVPY